MMKAVFVVCPRTLPILQSILSGAQDHSTYAFLYWGAAKFSTISPPLAGVHTQAYIMLHDHLCTENSLYIKGTMVTFSPCSLTKKQLLLFSSSPYSSFIFSLLCVVVVIYCAVLYT